MTLAISEFMSNLNFILSRVEHDKSFIFSGPGCNPTDMFSHEAVHFLFTVHGGWSEWVRYGRCNADSCQMGTQLRSRVCNKPRPRHKGLMCRGNSVEQTECFNDDGTCKGLLLFQFYFQEPILLSIRQ